MANRPHIFTAYDTPPKFVLEFGTSLTRQSERDACDVNTIMRAYELTGVLPHDGKKRFYLDVSEMSDYRTALDQIHHADNLFSQLPAQVRKRFGNDPAIFLDFVADPQNQAELEEMGLIQPENVEPEPKQPVEPATETAPEAPEGG